MTNSPQGPENSRRRKRATVSIEGVTSVAPSLFTRNETLRRGPRVEQAQELQTGADAVGRPKKKARTPGPRLEVLKVGGCPRDAFEKARDYSTPRHVMTVAEIVAGLLECVSWTAPDLQDFESRP